MSGRFKLTPYASRLGRVLLAAAVALPRAANADVALTFSDPNNYVAVPGLRPLSVDSNAAVTYARAPLFVGDGHLGAFDATQPNTIINHSTAITADVATGASQVVVQSATGFSAGALVLFIQVQGASGVSGTQTPLGLRSHGVFEWARLQGVSGSTLTLATPLVHAYSASQHAQAVTVPEYTDFTVEAGSSVVPPSAWDGSSGGVVALAATGTVTVLGSITADGQGLRGGAPNPTPDATCNISTLDDPNTPAHAGGKGESAVNVAFGQAGRGNVGNGGGGGDPDAAGGGGGGNGGWGGLGGGASAVCGDTDPAGGLPGVVAQFSAAHVLSLGGGGGAGQQNASSSGGGGAGGGVIFILAANLTGNLASGGPGALRARGNAGASALGSPQGGGGGGGAGGTIYALLQNQPTGALVWDVGGGAGGNVPGSPVTGPGGGGGGGWVFSSADYGLPNDWVATGGVFGAAPGNVRNGATAGQNGGGESGGYVQLASPVTREICLAGLKSHLVSGDPNAVAYLLSRDGGANWEFFNGTAWVTGARRANAQDAATVAAHLRSFAPVSSFNMRAYLVADANAPAMLHDVQITSCACGDGVMDTLLGEQCDDGNTHSGDGCSATCVLEPGYSCGVPGPCAPSCGNNVLNVGEQCDDGNLSPLDGCDPYCKVEAGYVCYGSPSTCPQTCGNGALDQGEQCDDTNQANGDGCSNWCQIEAQWVCSGAPSVCQLSCGDGLGEPGETCDDSNTHPRDGCSPTCQLEPGWVCGNNGCARTCSDGVMQPPNEACDDENLANFDGCTSSCQLEQGWVCVGQPSLCAHTCGNATPDFGEQCDDGNAGSGDGCSANCQTEPGWTCKGTPSVCVGKCGNGVIAGNEQCDDGNLRNGDGCSATCIVEPGYVCLGQPSVCVSTCGNGRIDAGEGCDPGTGVTGDVGCNNHCSVERGWKCFGQPSVCSSTCGDGIMTSVEQCDDGNAVAGDGCDATCHLESGWTCQYKPPSVCAAVCGDGMIQGGKQCDDRNTQNGDGCSSTCQIEAGYACSGQPSACRAVCGDGIVMGQETCDDHNTLAGDGCSASCQIEPRYNCTGQPSRCWVPGSSDPNNPNGAAGGIFNPNLLFGNLGGFGCSCADTTPADGVWLVALWLWRRRRR